MGNCNNCCLPPNDEHNIYLHPSFCCDYETENVYDPKGRITREEVE